MENRKFNLDEYETVETRLAKFWEKYPNGRVSTSIDDSSDGQYVVVAELFRDISDKDPFTVGHAQERVGVGMVNKTSALENCETSAIGRALANGGFASTAGKRPSREEMQKVQRLTENAPAEAKAVAENLHDIKTLDELRKVWETNIALLEEVIENNTLRELLLAHKELIEENE